MIILYLLIGLVALILYAYVVYPSLIWVVSRFKRRGHVVDNDILPMVSLVVAAHNEEAVIRTKIENSLALDYPKDKLEILIGSDGSKDKTDEICAEFGEEIVFKRIEPRQGKANVLNTLFPLTRGDIIFFSDANTIIEPDALKKMVRHFGDDSIGGVCGRLVLDASSANLVSLESRYWKFESSLKAVESQVYSIIGSNGAIYSIRKELFQPFPKDIIIDDFWISLGILEQGKRVSFEVDAVGREEVSMNIVDEFWRKVRIGGGNMQAFSRKPFIRGKTWLLTNFMFYSHKVIRWAIPLMLVAIYIGILLLSEEPPFDVCLRVCNLVILVAMLGVLLEEKITIINAFSYFLLFNFALLLGYIRYLMKRQSVLWKSAQRRISQG